jgi:general secretion pathway protein L
MATAIQNQFQHIGTRLQRSQFGHFLRWWVAELVEMLPASARAKMEHARRHLVVQMDSGELAVSLRESGSLHQLEVISLEQDARLQQQQIQGLLVERELTGVPLRLLLPESRMLRKQVLLPLAAEANLRQALAFEMDRQTPFQADDVFFDFRVLQRDREAAQLRVEVMVTRRQPLLHDVQQLSSLGVAPSGVDVAIQGEPADVNLLPPDLRHRVVNRKSRANLVLAGTFAILLVFVMVQSLWLKQHQLEELREVIEGVRDEAMLVQEVRSRISDASEAAGFLQARRSSAVPTVKVLTEVTRILPDNTFLDRLLVDSGSVQMQGKSENAQQLIELVNQSPMFEDASFRGPTRLDSRTDREIFDLVANVFDEGAN